MNDPWDAREPLGRPKRRRFLPSLIAGPLGLVLLVGFSLLSLYWLWQVPAPGKAVALLGVAALVVAFRSESGALEKAGWLTLGILLLNVEYRAIDRERADASTRIEKLTTLATDASQRMEGLATQANDASKRMEGLASLATEGVNTMTGGDSFCYLEIFNVSSPAVVHVGRYPLYDVELRVVDTDELHTNPATAVLGQTVHIGNLAPGLSSFDPTIRVPHDDRMNLNVFFTARNGAWTQLFRLRITERSMMRATLVTRRDASGTERILKEDVDPTFPKSELALDTSWVNAHKTK